MMYRYIGHSIVYRIRRSHALFTVYVDSMIKGEDGHITTRHGKMTFVDLAGYPPPLISPEPRVE